MNLLWFENLLLVGLWVWNAYLVLLWNRALAYPRALLPSGGPLSREFWQLTTPLIVSFFSMLPASKNTWWTYIIRFRWWSGVGGDTASARPDVKTLASLITDENPDPSTNFPLTASFTNSMCRTPSISTNFFSPSVSVHFHCICLAMANPCLVLHHILS